MAADERIEYTVKVSYMEIYMEKIKDLLARTLACPIIALQHSGQHLRGRPGDG
jgi:kinesin family protein 5